MLTADLIRARRRNGVVHPRYVDPANPELARICAELVGVFEGAWQALQEGGAGPRKADLETAIDDLVGERSDPLLFRGLCKLLWDRATFDTPPSPIDAAPPELREALFEQAARSPVRREPGKSWAEKRAALLKEHAAALGVTAEALEARLYADVEANQRLVDYKPIRAEQLPDRYNLALAQAVLLRATRLTIDLRNVEVGACRQLFRALKFHQLIHRVQRVDSDGTSSDGAGYHIEVDGPLSLFANANRYGVAMAQFLPTLALLPEWHLEAEVLWGPERTPSRFQLDHRRGLKSHRKARGQYVTDEQKWLESRFDQKSREWRYSREVEILRTARGAVVVPDLVFEHTGDGRRAFLEIIGFWRKGSLLSRLEMLEDPALGPLLLAVSKRLSGEKSKARKRLAKDHPRIVWFKQVILLGPLLEALDRVAS
jgi:predicted nuclease of restriction endonuclease-like RecB superfamily